MPAGGMITSGLIGGGLAIYGAIKKNQDAKAAANNQRPTYNIPQEEYDNQRLAASQAGQGMSATSRQAYQNSADSGLATTNDAILRSGGDPNAIGNAYNNYQQGINNLSIYDDQARMNHLNSLMAQNKNMAGERDKAWQVNQYAPWADKAQALALKQQGDQQLIGQGLGIIGSGAMGAAQHFANLGKKAPTTTTGNNVPLNSGTSNFTNGWLPNNGNNFTDNFGGMSTAGTPQASPGMTGSWNGIGIIPYQ